LHLNFIASINNPNVLLFSLFFSKNVDSWNAFRSFRFARNTSLCANSPLTYENHDKKYLRMRGREMWYTWKHKSLPENEFNEMAWGKIFSWAQYDIWSFNAVQFFSRSQWNFALITVSADKWFNSPRCKSHSQINCGVERNVKQNTRLFKLS
jgi:hypothetical protein